MVPDRTRPLLVALVAILAIALAAATLNTAVSVEGAAGGGQGGLGDGSGADVGPQDGGDPMPLGFEGLAGTLPVIPLPCLPVLAEPWFLWTLGIVAVVGLYGLARRTGPLVPVGVVVAVGPPGLLVYLLLTACRSAGESSPGLALPLGAPANTSALPMVGGSGGAAGGGTPVLSVALFAVLGLALVVAVALLLQSTGDEVSMPDDRAAPATERMAAIGRAAGRAADRIEGDADVDNAVYRAWQEMTALLDVANPAARTSAEFADAAVTAGLAADDVAELTDLFEAVRYGRASPTADREARAVAALRRIEAAYAGERS